MALRTFATLIGTGGITGTMLGSGSVDATKMDLTDDYNFTGALEVDGTAVATGSGSLYYAVVDLARSTNVADLGAGAPLSVDSVNASNGNDILVWGQSTSSQNGIYNVDSAGSGSNGAWSRAGDRDAAAELPAGLLVYVKAGTNHGSKLFKLTTAPASLGSDPVVFEEEEEGLTPGGTRGVEAFTGDGSVTTFDLQAASPAYVGVFIDGIEQTITTNYSYSATGGSGGVARITMTAAPANGAVVSVYTLYRA